MNKTTGSGFEVVQKPITSVYTDNEGSPLLSRKVAFEGQKEAAKRQAEEAAKQAAAEAERKRKAEEAAAVKTAQLDAEEAAKAKNAEADRERRRNLEIATTEGRRSAKFEADLKDTVFNAGQAARRSKPRLKVLQDGLKELRTGKVAQARGILSKIIPGIADADAEVFESMITKFAMDELAQQSGTKTDQDMINAKDINAKLGNTREANEQIIGLLLDNLDRAEAEEAQLKSHLESNGKAADFKFTAAPPKALNFLLENNDDKKIRSQFKAKYGYLPSRS